jgi:hypothetical protein
MIFTCSDTIQWSCFRNVGTAVMKATEIPTWRMGNAESILMA